MKLRNCLIIIVFIFFVSCDNTKVVECLKVQEQDTIHLKFLFSENDEIKYDLSNYINMNRIDRFDREIERFLISDITDFPAKGQILFIGSSSIRIWYSLADDMYPLKTIRRGFGGATIPETIHYSDLIIFRYEPKKIVYYCGENDHYINSPQKIYESFQIIERLIHSRLPETELYFISVKPSIARRQMWKKMSITNRLIKKYTELTPKTYYIDVSSHMFNDDHSIKNDIFIKDKLHMNSKGYEIWTPIIKKHIE